MARPSAGYRNAKGEKIPGVTTVIGGRVNPGGLLWWSNRLAYEPLMQARALLRGCLEGAPAIQAIHDLLDVPDEAFDHNKAAARAADAGTLAHAMVEAHLLGRGAESVVTSDALKDVYEKASTAFLAFLEWADQTKLTVVKTELSLVSENHQFGGTMDACVLSINNKRGLGDWKSASGIYPDHLIQLGGYDLLYAENFPQEPIEGGYHIFRFDKNTADFHHHMFQDIGEARQAFLLLRQLYDLDKALAKRVK